MFILLGFQCSKRIMFCVCVGVSVCMLICIYTWVCVCLCLCVYVLYVCVQIKPLSFLFSFLPKAAALESHTCIYHKDGRLPSLSEQQLVDCSRSYGNNGCGGGHVLNAFKYSMKNRNINEVDYPYQAKVGPTQVPDRRQEVVTPCEEFL